MKRACFSAAAGAVAGAALLCAPIPGAGQAVKKASGKGGKNWYADYAPARAEAKATGKPMFVVFRCQP
jgi:hypothetical protein